MEQFNLTLRKFEACWRCSWIRGNYCHDNNQSTINVEIVRFHLYFYYSLMISTKGPSLRSPLSKQDGRRSMRFLFMFYLKNFTIESLFKQSKMPSHAWITTLSDHLHIKVSAFYYETSAWEMWTNIEELFYIIYVHFSMPIIQLSIYNVIKSEFFSILLMFIPHFGLHESCRIVVAKCFTLSCCHFIPHFKLLSFHFF